MTLCERSVTEPTDTGARTPANKGRCYPAEVLTPEEVRALIKACSNRAPTGVRNRALLVVLYRAGVRISEALTGFISMNGELDIEVTRVLEVDDLALVTGVWSFNGTGPDGEPVQLAARNADVLRRQSDGTWRFVIDNPWGTD